MVLQKMARTALFAALMMGNVSIPVSTQFAESDNFIEDDEDYVAAPEALSNRWGWVHLNAAQAYRHNDQTENVTVIGIPHDPDPFGGGGGGVTCAFGCEQTQGDHQTNGGGGTDPIDAIEAEQKKQWCEDQLARIPEAKARCEANAQLDYAYARDYVCNNEKTSVSTSGIKIHTWFDFSFTSTKSCSEVQKEYRDAANLRCESDALTVERTIKAQCK
jgi:hypothetical protein